MVKTKPIRISEELHKYLTEQGNKSETYDQVIKRLIEKIWKVDIDKK